RDEARTMVRASCRSSRRTTAGSAALELHPLTGLRRLPLQLAAGRRLPADRHLLLLAHDLELRALPGVIAAEDAAGVRLGGGAAAVNREDHVPRPQLAGGVLRGAEHQQPLAGAEVFPQLGGQLGEVQPAAALEGEAELARPALEDHGHA